MVLEGFQSIGFLQELSNANKVLESDTNPLSLLGYIGCSNDVFNTNGSLYIQKNEYFDFASCIHLHKQLQFIISIITYYMSDSTYCIFA
jgi:hypothetical protein